MDDPYARTPLSRGRTTHEFRLLELQPSELFGPIIGPIRCTLRTYSFDSKPPAYTALSYTWGSASIFNVILLNGVPFIVGYNLWSFLKEMRSQRQYHVYYWIDAICINQKNVLERNDQVQIMRRIYSTATSVSIWLGGIDQFPYVNDAMKFLATDESIRSLTEKEARGIVELFNRGYWSRVWIIQEIMLARNCTIHYRNFCIDLSRFGALIEALNDIFFREDRPFHGLPRELLDTPAAMIVSTKVVLGRSTQPSAFLPFMQMLQLFRQQKATNILDKVYALHGLAPDTEILKVDYGISPDQLVVRVLQFAVVKIKLEPMVDLVERRRRLIEFGEIVAGILEVEWPRSEVRLWVAVVDD